MSTPTHLRSVNEDAPAPTGGPPPMFEGQPVHDVRVKLTSVAKLEAGEEHSRIDDTVRMYVEGRVVRVDHVVDEPTGELHRIETVKVVDAVRLPWNFDSGQLD